MPQDKFSDLHVEFGRGRTAAVLDALELCRDVPAPVPAWVIEALLSKREAIVKALKPPEQQVHPVGYDMLAWGMINVDEVPAGRGQKIVAGRISAEVRRAAVEKRNKGIVATYQSKLKELGVRHGTVSAAFRDWAATDPSNDLTLKQFTNVLAQKGQLKKRSVA